MYRRQARQWDSASSGIDMEANQPSYNWCVEGETAVADGLYGNSPSEMTCRKVNMNLLWC